MVEEKETRKATKLETISKGTAVLGGTCLLSDTLHKIANDLPTSSMEEAGTYIALTGILGIIYSSGNRVLRNGGPYE